MLLIEHLPDLPHLIFNCHVSPSHCAFLEPSLFCSSWPTCCYMNPLPGLMMRNQTVTVRLSITIVAGCNYRTVDACSSCIYNEKRGPCHSGDPRASNSDTIEAYCACMQSFIIIIPVSRSCPFRYPGYFDTIADSIHRYETLLYIITQAVPGLLAAWPSESETAPRHHDSYT